MYSGDKNIKPKREHVIAVMEEMRLLASKTQRLHSVMTLAYEQACKNREKQGLSIPEPPKDLLPFLKKAPKK